MIVARSYVPLLNSGDPATSTPDDYSPRDRVGHGTATAMAAAGETNTGPSDTITGVAPKAFLGSYKVFGSPGVNDFTSGDAVIEAIEDAFNDGMDIVSMSLGGPALAGPQDSGSTCGLSPGQVCDPEAETVQEAVLQGMVVVVAAGNEGGTRSLSTAALNTVDAPADAPNAIAVTATTNSHGGGNDRRQRPRLLTSDKWVDGPARHDAFRDPGRRRAGGRSTGLPPLRRPFSRRFVALVAAPASAHRDQRPENSRRLPERFRVVTNSPGDDASARTPAAG